MVAQTPAAPTLEPLTCFVVMPFGTKPRADGSPHDFDKIYRVVIRRAVEQAGMRCIRADETSGSRLIHSDMFLDLRDQPLVIADLSLQNPNVFYELGIRHVMSSTGTVLMCDSGSMPLPFDVGLSRVVPYEYDGKNLDWEEAERLVALMTAALLESASGIPDSPVHAMLERVLSEDRSPTTDRWMDAVAEPKRPEEVTKYEELIASTWRERREDFSTLYRENCRNVFGCRALGHYVLAEENLEDDDARKTAGQLSDLGEFSLASEVYEKLRKSGSANDEDLVRYATTYSESHPSIDGADEALSIVAEARAQVEARFGSDSEERQRIVKLGHCRRREAGLRQWRWELTREPNDLDAALEAHSQAIDLMEQARSLGGNGMASLLAQSHLKRMLLMRRRDGGPTLTDPMHDVDAILAIRPETESDPKHASYLRWYKTIALADDGAADRVQQSALDAFARDTEIMNEGSNMEIGRRQYVQLRRFLEEYTKWFRHPELVGIIGQTLQARR